MIETNQSGVPGSPQSILQHVFGYHSFRGDQQAIIDTVTAGDDALVIIPTGGGKSLCYQIPALLRPGVAVVVSPLIALMQNQVAALKEQGVRAALLNSTLDGAALYAVERAMRDGELDIVYIAPERLIRDHTQALLQRCQLALFAIDEAHCVAQWGHDFRVDYLKLDILQNNFPRVPRIALTATADERTRQEIQQRLGLENARLFMSGFDRPNIQYRITPKDRPRDQLLAFLKAEQAGHSGIVYCLSRKKVDTTAHWLQTEGYNALPYHAGLEQTVRAENQDRFLREDNIVMVATIAFGMGIDKPDVRFVAHLDMPKSIEAYYQETGRAGRDGEPAVALLLYGIEDVMKLRQMVDSSQAQESFRQHERRRLDAMLALCETASCRRQTLLQYFGETGSEACGNCDVCLQKPETWDATEAARMGLSCIYRTGQRFGVQHIIDVLRGSVSAKVRQHGHDTVSTYGIGRDLSVQQWRSIFRQLVARGLVDIDGEYGSLMLSGRCKTLLRGGETLYLRKDTVAPAAPKTASRQPAVDEADLPLFQALKACRRRLADAHGVPPFVIFHDSTLREMAMQKPRDRYAMLAITGVGDTKMQKYGDDFLEVMTDFEYSFQD